MVRSAESGGITDVQEDVGVLARLGGDKFTILLDHIRNASEEIRSGGVFRGKRRDR
jgi:GGDEF domain-containing protein